MRYDMVLNKIYKTQSFSTSNAEVDRLLSQKGTKVLFATGSLPVQMWGRLINDVLMVLLKYGCKVVFNNTMLTND